MSAKLPVVSLDLAGQLGLGFRALEVLRQKGNGLYVQKQLKAIERLRDLEADKFFNTAAKPVRSDGEVIGVVQAVALYLRNGKNVTSEQATAIHNAMSTTTASEGGYTVPTEVEAMVIENNVTEFVLSKAKINEKSISFDELMAQS